VTLVRSAGPIAFERDGRRAPLADFVVQRSDAGVAITDGKDLTVDLVEHLLAALGGLAIHDGVTAIVEGPELPILDGGARCFAEALQAIGSQPSARPLVVTRTATLEADGATYVFEPSEDTALTVETTFDHPAIGTERASWDGSPETFSNIIAPARTFGFQSDQDALWVRERALLAKQCDDGAKRAFASAVIVFDARGQVADGDQRRLSAGEIARHKLLDLIGDFSLYGGVPAGRVAARRPGHAASHRIIRQALSRGILSRR
jgi:UDP-3-O-[3-hydroxymyristoyl] N-acetylglucosamine deacetylase